MAGKRKSKALKGSKIAGCEGTADAIFNAAARTLSIPELLSIIFSFSEAPELARSARVCKNWSDPALDELWRDMDSVFPLLELILDPDVIRIASLTPGDLETISSVLADAKWPRFHSYANRVQFLYINSLVSPTLDAGLVGAICLHHPYGPSLLPRLKRLGWYTRWSALLLIPFLSEDLVHLDLELYSTSDARTTEILGALQHRKLKLKTFRLDTKAAGRASEAVLALWIKKMETLERLELPPYYFTERILTAIRTFPKLQIIGESSEDPGYLYNDNGFLGTLPDGSFPSLTELTLPATPAAAQHLLFNSPTNFTGLAALNICAIEDIEANQILAFTQQLARHCPTIAIIGLAFFLDPDFHQEPSVLPIEVLESLYPCKHLNDLRIRHPLPVKLNPADVENMAQAWPRINHLCLSCEPEFSFPVSEQMGTSLSILPALALHLPNLRTLGLYFNRQDRITFEGHLYPECQFTQLHTLFVGASPIPTIKIRDLGFYLASLCSQPPKLVYGYSTWHGETMPSDEEARETAWSNVGESMAFAMSDAAFNDVTELVNLYKRQGVVQVEASPGGAEVEEGLGDGNDDLESETTDMERPDPLDYDDDPVITPAALSGRIRWTPAISAYSSEGFMRFATSSDFVRDPSDEPQEE